MMLVFTRDSFEDVGIMNADQLIQLSSVHYRAVAVTYSRLLLLRLVVTARIPTNAIDPFVLGTFPLFFDILTLHSVQLLRFGITDGPANFERSIFPTPFHFATLANARDKWEGSTSSYSSSVANISSSKEIRLPSMMFQTIPADTFTQMLLHTLQPQSIARVLSKFQGYLRQEAQPLVGKLDISMSMEEKQSNANDVIDHCCPSDPIFQANLYKSGYLYKQEGAVFKNWKKCWCVLKGNRTKGEYLFYYSDKTTKRNQIPKIINLSSFSIQAQNGAEEVKDKKISLFPFKLTTDKKTYTLGALTYQGIHSFDIFSR